MTHPIKTRLFAPLLASILVPTLAAASVMAAPAVASAAVSKANCQMHAVLLSKEGDGTIPKELEFLRSTFATDGFAIYQGFFLLERKTVKLTLDTKADTSFRTGHRVGLTLLGGDDKRIKLHADLSSRDGSKSLLSTGYEIDDAGVLMISAGSYTDDERSGKAFFAISCSAAK
jgi:hypothetical protein